MDTLGTARCVLSYVLAPSLTILPFLVYGCPRKDGTITYHSPGLSPSYFTPERSVRYESS